MTSKQIYEATAIELSKVQAPALKLYEFNYFFNQAIRQFVNKVYNVYDVNQQTTDDLRVLKATATLYPTIADSTGNKAIDYLRGATYFVDMPDDYLHLLNCICLFDVNKRKDCWNAGDVMVVGATKLTADSWSSVVDDVYNQPTKKRPYYYVHNQNDIYVAEGNVTERNSQLPTNASTDKLHTLTWSDGETPAKIDYTFAKQVVAHSETVQDITTNLSSSSAIAALGTKIPSEDEGCNKLSEEVERITIANASVSVDRLRDMLNDFTHMADIATGGTSNFARTFDFDGADPTGDAKNAAIEKPAGSRYANSSRVKVEIRCGRDKSNIFSLSAVQVDYVKAPQFINLTQEQLDSDEDISQVMEFPDYVNQEIVNELVNLVMRKTNDPSLQAHIQMTQSIARPTGQQQQPATQG